MSFDRRHLPLEQAVQDVRGRLVAGKDGWARQVSSYDLRGLCTEVRFFDIDGQLATTAQGYARQTFEYRDDGRWLGARHWDRDGRPVRTRFVVVTLERDGGGAAAGLRKGDVIVSYDGRELDGGDAGFSTALVDPRGRDTLDLLVLRGDRRLTLHVASGPVGATWEARRIADGGSAGSGGEGNQERR